ncbi:MAG: hypothetical protein QM598_10360 [Protaetiibacter sp.]
MPTARRAADHPASEWAGLTALRAELVREYPDASVRRLRRVARRAGLRAFPDALMIDGRARPGILRTARLIARRILRRPITSRRHPLFSEPFYRAVNPDLEGVRTSLWLHYQVHGRLEGRSPHPLVDLDHLAAQMPGVRRAELLDRYLTFPDYWMLDPGPYVDVEGFVLGGAWDGRTHPFVQLLRTQAGEPWIRTRLQVVDLGSSGRSGLTLAAGVLRSRNQALFDRSRMRVIERAGEPSGASGGTAIVIPGYLLAVDGVEVAAGSASLLSPDATAIRLDDMVVTIDPGRRRQTSELIYLTGSPARDELSEIVRSAPDDALFAPADAAQEESLRELVGARALAAGKQVTVQARRVRTAAGPTAAVPRGWPRSELSASVVVLPERVGPKLFADPRFTATLTSGVACALVGASGIAPWRELIRSRTNVYVHPELVTVVLPHVDRRAITVLDQGATA